MTSALSGMRKGPNLSGFTEPCLQRWVSVAPGLLYQNAKDVPELFSWNSRQKGLKRQRRRVLAKFGAFLWRVACVAPGGEVVA